MSFGAIGFDVSLCRTRRPSRTVLVARPWRRFIRQPCVNAIPVALPPTARSAAPVVAASVARSFSAAGVMSLTTTLLSADQCFDELRGNTLTAIGPIFTRCQFGERPLCTPPVVGCGF